MRHIAYYYQLSIRIIKDDSKLVESFIIKVLGLDSPYNNSRVTKNLF